MKRKLHLVPRRVSDIDCDRPEVTIRVRTRYGDFVPLRLIVDTAADFTAIPMPLAQRLGLAFSQTDASRGTAAGLLGNVPKYRDSMRVHIAGEEFDRPCDFLEIPAPPAVTAPATPGLRPGRLNPVLGPAG